MTNRKSKSVPPQDLRHRAMDQMVTRKNSGPTPPSATVATYKQELAIHQVELELQNEELRAARIELEAGLDRYTQLFDFAPIGYATLGAGGMVRELNHVGAAFLFESRARLIGKRFALFIAPSDRPAYNELFRTVLESNVKETREFRLRSASEEQRVVRLTAATLAGAEPTVLLAFEDITAQKLAEERLLRADLALREADRRKDEFLAVLSHELRTPLSTLLMYGQLLRQAGLSEDKIQLAAEGVERAARIQTRLIDDLLDVSRIVAGKMSMQTDKVNLASVARVAFDVVGKEAEKKRITIELHIDAAMPAVWGDAERLQQVITNLLTNAVKFTPAGGQIRIRLDFVDKLARIQIEDTGAGIDADFLPFIFDRFSQADRTATRKTGGLGLGLSIARSIVEAHRGTIRAHSLGRGKGSTFTMTLPICSAPHAEPFSSRPPARKPEVETKMKGTRLLVVEDDASTRETLTEVLLMAGADVRGAEGGAAAMRVMNDFRPDVLVCDIGMPEEDGCALLRRIRARGPEAGGDVRALAITAFASDEDRRRTRAAGFETHLVKPIDIDQLIAAVSDLLRPDEELVTT